MKFVNLLNDILFEGSNSVIGGKKAQKLKLSELMKDLGKGELRIHFINDLKDLLRDIDRKFNKISGETLWPDIEHSLAKGNIYSGSASHLIDPTKPSTELFKVKPEFSDLDVQFPKEKFEKLKELMNTKNTGMMFGKFKYIGPLEGAVGDTQIINQFEPPEEYTAVSDRMQIDLEAVEFAGKDPTDFASFAHASDYEDLRVGVKGVFAKYLWMVLVNVKNKLPANAVIFTPTGRPKKEKEKSNDSTDNSLFYTGGTGSKSFSVTKGLRDRYLSYPEGGSTAFKEIKTDTAKYSTNLDDMFKSVFERIPTPEEKKLMNSFVGVLGILKKDVKKDVIENVLRGFLSKLFSPEAQGLEKNNPDADNNAKMAAVKKFIEIFPELEHYIPRINDKAEEYKKNYKMT